MDYLHGKLILVIGGTGDFCKAIFRSTLQHFQQSRIAVLSRDELNQYGFRPELGDHLWMRWFIRIACDRGRLSRAVSGVDVVEHAAAMKQLDTNDYNSFDCIAIDGMGVENVISTAIAAGVQRVVALSTEKVSDSISLVCK